MTLVVGIQALATRVGTEIKAVSTDLTTTTNRVITLEYRPVIIVSATAPVSPAPGTIWLDTSGP